MALRIAIVTSVFPPSRNSGAVQVSDLAREFTRQGYEVTVLVPGGGSATGRKIETVHGFKVARLWSIRFSSRSYLLRVLSECMTSYLMTFDMRRGALASEVWDGIIWYSPSIFHTPLVKYIKSKSRCRGYLVLRDVFPEWAIDLKLLQRGFVASVLSFFAWRQYSLADVIGVQSAGNLHYLEDWKAGSEVRELEVLPNWLGPVDRKKGNIDISVSALWGRKIFVYAGNFGVAQGLGVLADLVEEMSSHKDIGFVFVGSGSELYSFKKRLASKHLDNYLFFDEIDPCEVVDLYRQCDFGIVCLDRRHKSHNIPGKVVGYLQNGLPVLACLNPGNDLVELLENACVGTVCVSEDVRDFYRSCVKLIEMESADPDIGIRCLRTFEETFSVDAVVRQIVGHFA